MTALLAHMQLQVRSSRRMTHALGAGFQLVDGKERMIVVEGLADGAMQRMQGIALQALTGAIPQPSGTCRRAVHWHEALRSVLVTTRVQMSPDLHFTAQDDKVNETTSKSLLTFGCSGCNSK